MISNETGTTVTRSLRSLKNELANKQSTPISDLLYIHEDKYIQLTKVNTKPAPTLVSGVSVELVNPNINFPDKIKGSINPKVKNSNTTNKKPTPHPIRRKIRIRLKADKYVEKLIMENQKSVSNDNPHDNANSGYAEKKYIEHIDSAKSSTLKIQEHYTSQQANDGKSALILLDDDECDTFVADNKEKIPHAEQHSINLVENCLDSTTVDLTDSYADNADPSIMLNNFKNSPSSNHESEINENGYATVQDSKTPEFGAGKLDEPEMKANKLPDIEFHPGDHFVAECSNFETNNLQSMKRIELMECDQEEQGLNSDYCKATGSVNRSKEVSQKTTIDTVSIDSQNNSKKKICTDLLNEQSTQFQNEKCLPKKRRLFADSISPETADKQSFISNTHELKNDSKVDPSTQHTSYLEHPYDEIPEKSIDINQFPVAEKECSSKDENDLVVSSQQIHSEEITPAIKPPSTKKHKKKKKSSKNDEASEYIKKLTSFAEEKRLEVTHQVRPITVVEVPKSKSKHGNLQGNKQPKIYVNVGNKEFSPKSHGIDLPKPPKWMDNYSHVIIDLKTGATSFLMKPPIELSTENVEKRTFTIQISPNGHSTKMVETSHGTKPHKINEISPQAIEVTTKKLHPFCLQKDKYIKKHKDPKKDILWPSSSNSLEKDCLGKHKNRKVDRLLTSSGNNFNMQGKECVEKHKDTKKGRLLASSGNILTLQKKDYIGKYKNPPKALSLASKSNRVDSDEPKYKNIRTQDAKLDIWEQINQACLQAKLIKSKAVTIIGKKKDKNEKKKKRDIALGRKKEPSRKDKVRDLANKVIKGSSSDHHSNTKVKRSRIEKKTPKQGKIDNFTEKGVTRKPKPSVSQSKERNSMKVSKAENLVLKKNNNNNNKMVKISHNVCGTLIVEKLKR